MAEPLSVAANEVIEEYFPRIKSLSVQQQEILRSIFIENKDTFAILPTGHGKSLPYQIAPLVAQKLSGLAHHHAEFSRFKDRNIVIIISPLLALMEEQAKSLVSAGITACCLHDKSINKEDILEGKFQLVFGGAEAWVKSKKWRKMLQSQIYQQRLLLIAADEAHCIPKW